MKTLRQSVGIFIAILLILFLIRNFVQTHTHLKGVTFQVQWGWLFSSFFLLLLHRSAYLYPFAILLSGLIQKEATFHTAFILFHLANITRYLPGRIWGVVRLLSLSERFGFSKTAVGCCLTLHVGIETAIGGFLATSLFFPKQMRYTAQSIFEKVLGQTVLLALAVIGILSGVLFLIPTVSSHTQALLKTLRKVGTPLFEKSFWLQWYKIISVHILLWVCQGFAFFLFVQSLTPIAISHAGVLTSIYAFAWIVGFLSFLTPGGLGIREGLLGLLLINYMPVQQATFVALLCRIWMLSAEIVLASIAFLLKRDPYVPKASKTHL